VGGNTGVSISTFNQNTLITGSTIALADNVIIDSIVQNLFDSTEVSTQSGATISEVMNNDFHDSMFNIYNVFTTSFSSNSVKSSTIEITDGSATNYIQNSFMGCLIALADNGSFSGNNLQNINSTIYTSHVNQQAFGNVSSNMSVSLDISLVFNAGTNTLTIPAGYETYIGIFNLFNGAATDRVETIANPPIGWEYRIYNTQNNGNIVRFRKNIGNLKFHTGISGADIDLIQPQDFVQFQDYSNVEYLINYNNY
jgi:hypothetical protein